MRSIGGYSKILSGLSVGLFTELQSCLIGPLPLLLHRGRQHRPAKIKDAPSSPIGRVDRERRCPYEVGSRPQGRLSQNLFPISFYRNGAGPTGKWNAPTCRHISDCRRSTAAPKQKSALPIRLV